MPNAIIMAGGTGGHVFPALAVATQLRQQGWNILWLGTADRIESRVVPQHDFAIHFLPVKGLRGKGLLNRLAALWGVLRSVMSSFGTMRKHQPDVVVGFGGYPSFPGGIAAKLMGIPLVIHEQNAVPGLTNKILGRLAKQIFVGFPQAKYFFEQKGKTASFVGNPVREDISATQNTHEGAFRLLVLGGSLGARPLNQQLPIAVKRLPSIDIIHQCGAGNEQAVKQLYAEHSEHVHTKVVPFIDDMADAYSWADAVVCRAGALTVAEVAKAGLAACFIPLPHAVDDHQTKNAQYLADEGAAMVLLQPQMAEQLPKILANWVSDPQVCRSMGAKAAACLPNNATEQIVAACKQYQKESSCPQS